MLKEHSTHLHISLLYKEISGFSRSEHTQDCVHKSLSQQQTKRIKEWYGHVLDMGKINFLNIKPFSPSCKSKIPSTGFSFNFRLRSTSVARSGRYPCPFIGSEGCDLGRS